MDFDELNRQSYDKIAKQFSAARAYVWPDVQLFRDCVKDGARVLDLGCGNGRLIALFKNNVETEYYSVRPDYLGVDSSGELIKRARANYPDEKFEVMDALNLNLPEKSFDIVLSVSVLNHFAKENHQRFIENVKKVLKPGGCLLMSNWNMWNVRNKKSVWRLVKKSRKILKQVQDDRRESLISRWKDVVTTWKSGGVEAQLYYYAFTKGEIKRLLNRNGFEIKKNYYSRKGKPSNLFFGENIVTIAKSIY
ncbi:class I SAM-dependent methyltransferase [Candidatus Falkowbacteria bacterium]|nr:class I SAM-dependent methyltransferase [Candidatus Falkowbacteria bacterium]